MREYTWIYPALKKILAKWLILCKKNVSQNEFIFDDSFAENGFFTRIELKISVENVERMK